MYYRGIHPISVVYISSSKYLKYPWEGMRLTKVFSPLHLQNLKRNLKQSSLEGQWKNVLTNYLEINKAGLQLEDLTFFPSLFKACANLYSFREGTSFHALTIKKGLDSLVSIANSTMDFYMKCGAISSALGVFGCMEKKSSVSSVSWNIVIHGCLSHGISKEGMLMFAQAKAADFEPNISTLVLVLQACRGLGAIHEGVIIHGFLIQSGLLADVSVKNSLLSFYSKFDKMSSARKLFDEMPVRDVISWSVMIGEYVQCGESKCALMLFQELVSAGDEVGPEPDEFTLVSALKACSSINDIGLGRSIHSFVTRKGFASDTFVGNSLVDMYCKCFYIGSALKAFKEMPGKTIVSWNSMLWGFLNNEQYSEALTLFVSILEAGFVPDVVTMVTLLQVSKNLGDQAQCKSIHSRLTRCGFKSNLVINALIDAYAKCGLVELAWKLFHQMEKRERDTISWSTMITAFSHSGKPEAAISLFCEMVELQENFNSVTMLSLLEACSLTADLRRSKWAHGIALRHRIGAEVYIGTALLDMYAKCGEPDASRKIFDQMPEKNIVSWSAMIAAYAISGCVYDALSLLAEMECCGLKPNAVTMISVLSACNHSGLVEEGLSCFQKMIKVHGFQPNMEHYSCMVDMLGRAGNLNSAIDMIKSIPSEANVSASVWGALLSACRNHGNTELGYGAASRVLDMEPLKSAGYLLASSMYAASGLWREAARMRKMVNDKGVKVVAGYSLVHIENKAYKFVANDGTHKHFEEVRNVVRQLHNYIKMENRNFEK